MVSGLQLNKQQKATTPIILLGDMVFEVIDSPRNFVFTEKSTFSEISKIEEKPSLQWTGEALTTLSMDFRFGAAWCNPEEQLKELQTARAAHTALSLTIGTGVFAGFFVVEEVGTTLKRTDLSGNIVQCDVAIKLKETAKPQASKQFKRSPFAKRFF